MMDKSFGLTLERIWDPVIRVWHWVLVLFVCSTWALGEFMDFDTIQWHFYGGYVVLGLMALRIIWGMVGPAPVRFGQLLPRPSAIVAYAKTLGRRRPSGTPGHNPLGALSVLGLLTILSGQAVTGLFVESDDFFESGPMAVYASEALIGRLTWWHHLLAEVLMWFVILHVAAVFFYLIWKRENLIKPMLTGMKWVRREPK